MNLSKSPCIRFQLKINPFGPFFKIFGHILNGECSTEDPRRYIHSPLSIFYLSKMSEIEYLLTIIVVCAATAKRTVAPSGILQYTTNKQRKLTATKSSSGSSGSGGAGAGSNSTGGGGSGVAAANDGQGGTYADIEMREAGSGSGLISSNHHRLSGGLEFRGSSFGFGGGTGSSGGKESGSGGGGSGGGGLSGILSHSNNHLFHAMTGGSAAGGGGRADHAASGDVQATPPLQRRLAKSFSVAQSSSLQKGHYSNWIRILILH